MRRLLVVLSILVVGVLFALPAAPSSAGTGAHAAITIASNAGFSACGCVTSGSGTAASPYVIGPWSIAAPSGGAITPTCKAGCTSSTAPTITPSSTTISREKLPA